MKAKGKYIVRKLDKNNIPTGDIFTITLITTTCKFYEIQEMYEDERLDHKYWLPKKDLKTKYIILDTCPKQ